ncbi:MAG: hypothetical protein AB7S75_10285 [Desulfococcaceae bacterium]
MNNLPNISESYLKNLDSYIKKLVVSFGSGTEDNIESMNHIELGYSGCNFGIKIKNKDLFVSDIVNALEDMEQPPQEVKEYYPDITDQEWQASTRLSTLLLLLFEKSVKEKFLEKPEKEIKPALALYEI